MRVIKGLGVDRAGEVAMELVRAGGRGRARLRTRPQRYYGWCGLQKPVEFSCFYMLPLGFTPTKTL